jgi:membrane protease YdiL (CAAX protease family)
MLKRNFLGGIKMAKLARNYLLFTFLIMLACWGTSLIFSINDISIRNHYFLYIPYLIGGWSPTIASYIVLRKENIIKNFKEWLKNIFDFRHNIISYLMVIIFGLIYILPQCIISGYDNGAPLYAIILMLPMMLVGGGLEEAGWRYILQPELEKKFSFTVSTLIVSIIWWIWHLPLFFIKGASQYGTNYLGFGIMILGSSFLLASIRKNTGSVLLCVLLHCITNALSGIYLIKYNMHGNIITAIILILAAYISLGIQKKRIIFK